MSPKTKNTHFVAYTAVLLALLVGLQFVTKAFGQFVTGSCVNLILAVAAICCGTACGLTVALLSPFFAFLLGIGPAFIRIVPLIALGNAVYVLLIRAISGKDMNGKGRPLRFIAAGTAALCKFAVLFLTVTRLAVPSLGLPEAKAAIVSASFSWPQLVTALAGGLLAAEIAPLVKKAMK